MSKLSDGKEITVDLSKLKRKEYVKLSAGDYEDEELFPLVSKITNTDEDYLEDVSWEDWRRIMGAIHSAAYAPLDVDEKN